jgi:hypothetical protein
LWFHGLDGAFTSQFPFPFNAFATNTKLSGTCSTRTFDTVQTRERLAGMLAIHFRSLIRAGWFVFINPSSAGAI